MLADLGEPDQERGCAPGAEAYRFFPLIRLTPLRQQALDLLGVRLMVQPEPGKSIRGYYRAAPGGLPLSG